MHQFEIELKEFCLYSIEKIKNIISLKDFEFDHVCYQTKNSEEYNLIKTNLKEITVDSFEFSHSGRKLTILTLKNPLTILDKKIDKVEISEPKPKKAVLKSNFDHICFYSKINFDSAIKEIESKKIEIESIKQIGDARLAKIKINGLKLEIREKAILESLKQVNIIEAENVEKIKEELRIEKEKALRYLADYHNLSKRIQDDIKKAVKLSNIVLLNKIIEIIEDFDLAISHSNKKIDSGILTIQKKLKTVINSFGIVEIQVKENDIFNPEIHEAIGTVKAENEKQKNLVNKVVQNGYKYKETGEVVRPAKVIVFM